MHDPALPSQKALLRTEVRRRRDAIGEETRGAYATAIAASAERFLAERGADDVVALYRAKGSEVDTSAIDRQARQRRLTVVYPRVVAGQAWLAFHRARPEELAPGAFGLEEPAATAPAVELDAIACFFVPGLAFDEGGGRLGMGRGYYDASFARAPSAVRIGVAFEAQVVSRLPAAAHDIPMHWLITEERVRATS